MREEKQYDAQEKSKGYVNVPGFLWPRGGRLPVRGRIGLFCLLFFHHTFHLKELYRLPSE